MKRQGIFLLYDEQGCVDEYLVYMLPYMPKHQILYFRGQTPGSCQWILIFSVLLMKVSHCRPL